MANISRRKLLRGSANGAAAIVATAIGAPAGMSAVLPTSSPVVALAERAEVFRKIDTASSIRYSALIRGVPEDLRFGEGTPYRYPSDMPPDVLARYREFSDACSQAANGGLDSDAMTEARWAVEDELCATPSDDLAGLVAKLRWLVNNLCSDIGYARPTLEEAYTREDGGDDIERMVVSVWADAERLAKKGGAA
jgi:hypothetical protein